MITKTNLYSTIISSKLIFRSKHRLTVTPSKNTKISFKTISVLQEIQTIQILL